MKTLLACFGACVVVFLAYGAGTQKYECVTSATQAMNDGSGRWFYMCTGPEPRAGQYVGDVGIRDRFGFPVPAYARVSPAVPR